MLSLTLTEPFATKAASSDLDTGSIASPVRSEHISERSIDTDSSADMELTVTSVSGSDGGGVVSE